MWEGISFRGFLTGRDFVLERASVLAEAFVAGRDFFSMDLDAFGEWGLVLGKGFVLLAVGNDLFNKNVKGYI